MGNIYEIADLAFFISFAVMNIVLVINSFQDLFRRKRGIKKMFKNIDSIFANKEYNVVDKINEIEAELDYWRDHL
jgi:hypothetical protein